MKKQEDSQVIIMAVEGRPDISIVKLLLLLPLLITLYARADIILNCRVLHHTSP